MLKTIIQMILAEVILVPFYRFFPLLPILLLSLVVGAEEGSWQGSLQDGSRITIDPSTNKAMRTLDGETTPLWNGVHRLNNGAVIIVREGLVVRDETVIEAQEEGERNRLNAACMQLVTKVCGAHNECRSQPACDPARQLLAMERDELNSSWSGATLESSTLCLEALANEDFFTSCRRRDNALGATTCERLAATVCGEEGACTDSQGCDAARQLISMEQQDRYEFPGTLSRVSDQCREMLYQPTELFISCDR
jgi:hypothetical protein